jgi:hypothetical protein
MTCVPTPAVAGLKTPEALTPVPLQVPPGVDTVKVNAGSVTHFLGGIQIEGSQHIKDMVLQAPPAID